MQHDNMIIILFISNHPAAVNMLQHSPGGNTMPANQPIIIVNNQYNNQSTIYTQ